MHAQFIITPSFKKVSSIFTEATGKELSPDIIWLKWKPLSKETLDDISKYIRPCHSHILDETRNGTYDTPCQLLRQLLRPYDLRIEHRGKKWILLKQIEEEHETGIRTRSGCVINWV